MAPSFEITWRKEMKGCENILKNYLSTARVAIHLAKEGGRGKVGQVGRHVAQEVKGVAEEDGLHVGDRLHSGDVGIDFRLLLDVVGVTDGEAVEQVHQDDNDEEDEGEEEGVGEHPKVGRRVHWQVTEL